MAPRPLESREHFIDRLREAVAGGREQVRFGAHHYTHAVVREAEGWSVRRLELDMQRAEAYRAQHGMFMPEHAEMLSTPGAAAFEAGTLDALIVWLERQRWPL